MERHIVPGSKCTAVWGPQGRGGYRGSGDGGVEKFLVE